MERIKALIDKLYQQKQEDANPAQILLTVQLLQAELMKMQQKNGTLGTAKVAVTLPANLNFIDDTIPFRDEIQQEEMPPPSKPAPVSKIPDVKEIPKPPQREETQESKDQPQKLVNPAFNQNAEPPTLAAHSKKEIHEVIADKRESLNDRLKQEKTEVVHTLKDAPIKDLKRGIGINDRFTFVNELFRGDEAMYERSIKTINGFHILSEAEYWINRELKFKLGWNDNKEIVQHFYQLVRRRFS
jgi:hypothetical protein